jgi:hypothetical protein
MANSGISKCSDPQCENYPAEGAWVWKEPGKRRMRINAFCAMHGGKLEATKKALHISYRPGFMVKPLDKTTDQTEKRAVKDMSGNHFVINYGDWLPDGTRYLTNMSGFSIIVVHKDGTRETVKHKKSTAVRKTITIEAEDANGKG